MHVENQFGERADGADHIRTERYIRHEMAVHDVEMQPVGFRSLDAARLPGERS